MPIVFVTARDSVDDEVKGLTVGGDDYVTKPFSLEVVARIRAVHVQDPRRGDRGRGPAVPRSRAQRGLPQVRRGNRVIDVSPTEFKLLRYLLLNPNRVLSKAQILDHVWDYDFRGRRASSSPTSPTCAARSTWKSLTSSTRAAASATCCGSPLSRPEHGGSHVTTDVRQWAGRAHGRAIRPLRTWSLTWRLVAIMVVFWSPLSR